jgi:Tfp pilus assembly protein PilO
VSPAARKRVFLAAAGLGLLNVGLYVAYTLPRSLQKRNVADRVQQLEGDLAADRQRVAELRTRAENILANRKESRTFLDERLGVPDTALGPVLDEVEAMIHQQGLKLGQQGFERETIKGLPLVRFGITMPVTGTYDQVAGLIQQLEHSSSFLTLDQIAAQKQGDEGVPTVDLKLAFSAYFRAGGTP